MPTPSLEMNSVEKVTPYFRLLFRPEGTASRFDMVPIAIIGRHPNRVDKLVYQWVLPDSITDQAKIAADFYINSLFVKIPQQKEIPLIDIDWIYSEVKHMCKYGTVNAATEFVIEFVDPSNPKYTPDVVTLY